jgi:hypothetical protein
MKLHVRIPEKLIRVELLQRGSTCKVLQFEDTTPKDVLDYIVGLVSDLKKDTLIEGQKAQVTCYFIEGNHRSEYVSKTVHGVSPEYLKELIIDSL